MATTYISVHLQDGDRPSATALLHRGGKVSLRLEYQGGDISLTGTISQLYDVLSVLETKLSLARRERSEQNARGEGVQID